MQRIRFIEHRGVRVLLTDYSPPITEAEGLAAMDECRRLVAQQPLQSLLLLTNVTGAYFNTRAVQGLKDLAAHNSPYVRRSAVVGVSGLQKIIYQAVQRFAKRDIVLFSARQDALDWLVQDQYGVRSAE